MNEEASLNEEIDKRFSLLITIAIFFAVLMTAYLQLTRATSEQLSQAFVLYPVIGFYVGAYVFFQIAKLTHPPKIILQILQWVLLFAIVSFVLPILFTIVAEGPIHMSSFNYQVNMAAYMGSLGGISILPFILFWFSFATIFARPIVEMILLIRKNREHH